MFELIMFYKKLDYFLFLFITADSINKCFKTSVSYSYVTIKTIILHMFLIWGQSMKIKYFTDNKLEILIICIQTLHYEFLCFKVPA